jgi:transcriptional regulator with XRE-family HTH domain
MPGLTGTRIREARKRAGLPQQAVAAAAGISPAYMNLIEHNRRGVAGRLLVRIAEALGTTPAALTGASDAALLGELREAAGPDLAEADEAPETFLGRSPFWARLLVRTAARARGQQAVVAALSDRLAHDPFLQDSVHGMLSTITSVRSVAAILAQVDDIPPDQLQRFHRNLNEDSLRLSTVAEGLAAWFARAGAPGEGPVTPEEALDAFLLHHAHVFDALDEAAAALAGADPGAAMEELAAMAAAIAEGDAALPDAPARRAAERHLRQYAADALAMPLDAFSEAARAAGYDPAPLATRFGQGLHAVFRRLAVLRRPRIEAPSFGLVACSASGFPLLRQPLPDFPMPRHGSACARWPLFHAFSQPSIPIATRFAHDNGKDFVALAVALPRDGVTFAARTDMTSAMLVARADASPFALRSRETDPVGTSCRICTQPACTARSEAAIIT